MRFCWGRLRRRHDGHLAPTVELELEVAKFEHAVVEPQQESRAVQGRREEAGEELIGSVVAESTRLTQNDTGHLEGALLQQERGPPEPDAGTLEAWLRLWRRLGGGLGQLRLWRRLAWGQT